MVAWERAICCKQAPEAGCATRPWATFLTGSLEKFTSSERSFFEALTHERLEEGSGE